MLYSAVRVSKDSIFTNVVVVRLITLTSVSAIHFLDGVYNMEAVHVSYFKLLTFFYISKISKLLQTNILSTLPEVIFCAKLDVV